MNGDRELLEKAARAAGIGSVLCYESKRSCLRIGDRESYQLWRPIDNDSDAFQLAVKLRLGMVPLEGGGWDVVRFDYESCRERTLAACANSGDWALREAIVRAAASVDTKEGRNGNV